MNDHFLRAPGWFTSGAASARVSPICIVLCLFVVVTSGCDPYRNMTVEEIGKKVYKTQCAICHQIDGRGVPEMQPALADSAIVVGEPAQLITVILEGSSAELLAGRDQYSNFMAGFDYLRDFEIAAVATYLRSGFGNQASSVSEADVAAQR